LSFYQGRQTLFFKTPESQKQDKPSFPVLDGFSEEGQGFYSSLGIF
jgi:hypothetical protein